MPAAINVRFAPSPTGYLHVGNVRTALVNWLFARANGGAFWLRLDDTDQERSRAEYAAAIEQDLRWLGLNWDGFFTQSSRLERYENAKKQLQESGRLYPCFETAEELEIQRKMQTSRGLPPIYNRAALKLTDEQKQEFAAQGRAPHYRFLLENRDVEWADLVRGPSKMRASHMSDPVLVREDGVPLYTLASVVDDIDYAITHIVRGEDHVSNTAVQIQIFEALGAHPPQFAHLALLKTKEGELSKRLGGNDIRSLRDHGIHPLAVCAMLAKMGTSDTIEPVGTREELIRSFDFAKFGRAPTNYDVKELEKFSEKLLRQLPFSLISDQLPGVDESFWNSVRGNIATLAEVRQWRTIIDTLPQTDWSAEDRAFLQSASGVLPPEPWDEATYDAWIAAIKPTTERKGKELFMPLRKALTGLEHGPELKKLLPLLGREKTMQRLLP